MTARSIHGHGMRRAAVAMGQHAVLLVDSFNYAGKRLGPKLQQIERSGPR